MIYFSSLINSPKYRSAADRISAALKEENVAFSYIENTKDIWLRDFMPVKTKSGKHISFLYEPSYLENDKDLRTNYRDIEKQMPVKITYSEINLDGGNVVFSPSKDKAIISDRVFSENPGRQQNELITELQNLLEAKVIIIPSLKSDMTGHADGMVRFVDENTVIGNDTGTKYGLESKIKKVLKKENIAVMDFPYFESKGISANGCYLNFLETEKSIFLPVFGAPDDKRAIEAANRIFTKKIVPIEINEIAVDGGCLNCISWEI